MKLTACVLAVLFAALTSPALAQNDGEDPAKDARVHLGPLALNPTVMLTNFGVDNNVFNQTDTDHPKSDFTTTVTPQTAWSVRFGRSSVIGNLKEDLVYYQHFASERSANTTQSMALRVPLNRLTITLGDTYVNTRDRPGFEIDARSQHTQTDYTASAEIRALGKTFIAIRARRGAVAFERDALFLGSSLQQQLNRHETSVGVSARHELTPMTSVTFGIDRQEDRFEFSPLRDSSSTAVSGGVEFRPRALIGGSASLGYRSFEPVAHDIPGYQGLTARGDVAFRVLSSTKLGVQMQRDVQYSYDYDQPYYLLSGGTVSVTQALHGPVELAGRAGLSHLAYRGRIGAEIPLSDRIDSIHTFGTTLGYRVNHGMRVGFNIDWQQRISDQTQHHYSGVRFGTSVTYGL